MTATLSSLMEGFLSHALYGEPVRLMLDFGGYVTLVESNSQTLVDKLSDYYRDFRPASGAEVRPDTVITVLEGPPPSPDDLEKQGVVFTIKQPEPGKTKIKEEWCDVDGGRLVRKRLTGMLFLFGGDNHIAVGPCIENDNQLVNFINSRCIEWTLNRGALLFHAAGVARNGEGLSLGGFSGMGKSTLALHIMCQGTDFVSNDRLMVRRQESGQLTMHGVAKMPRINPGTILHNPSLAGILTDEERREFEMLPPEDLWKLEHKYDGFIDECFGEGRFKLQARMSGLVLLNWFHGGGEMIARPVDLKERPDLMPAFMKSVGLFYDPLSTPHDPPDYSRQAYLELLADCPVYELSGGVDFEKAAAYCNDLLK